MKLRAFLLLLVFAMAAAAHGQHSPSGSTATTFDKFWTVAFSQFDQSNQAANSLAEFANGNLYGVGEDIGIQPNGCKGFLGGAWMISTDQGGGNVFQKLFATCDNSGQKWTTIRPTPDDGGILIAEDDASALCNPCAMVAKSDSLGNLTFAQDLTTFAASELGSIMPTIDGGYITAGLGQPVLTAPTSGLVMKLSSTGAPQWGQLFTENNTSFPGAVAGPNNPGLVLSTVSPTADGGSVVSGVADAHFTNGFANVLTVIKLNSSQGVDWAKVYYSSNWGSWGAGGSRYSIIPTKTGYVVSGTLQGVASQFAFPKLFFLLSLDLQGNIVWQKGYGDSVNNADGEVAISTTDGGYLLGGETNLFGSVGGEYLGWLIKTDANGNITWQNRYSAGEPAGSNSDTIKDIIQTRDGDFAVAGYAYTGSLTYGGPSFWLFKTDSQGIVSSTCCQAATTTIVQPIDLQAFNAVYAQASVTPTFTPITLTTKKTSVTPTSLF